MPVQFQMTIFDFSNGKAVIMCKLDSCEYFCLDKTSAFIVEFVK